MTLFDKYQGVIPALLTPYDKDGIFLPSSLEKLIDHCLAQGASGFYVAGSTGESLLLSEAERKAVLECAVSHTNKRVPVIAHVGAVDTRTAVTLAKHANAAGADAVSAIPPVFFNYTPAEIERYYLDIADAADLPLFIYTIPVRTGIELTLDQICRLAAHPNIRGIKFTSTVLWQMERIRRALPEFVIFSGPDEAFLAGLSMGANAAIGSTYNLMCNLFVKVFESFKAGDMKAALSWQAKANDVLDAIFATGSVFHGLKAALALLGISTGDPRKPFAPLTEAQMASAQNILTLLDNATKG